MEVHGRIRESVRTALGTALDRTLDGLLPPQCAACGTTVDAVGRLCPTCWQDTTFIVEPLCALCGLPFEVPAPAGTECGSCVAAPPAFRRARAAVLYEGVGRDLVLALKLADRTWLAPTLARWMARAGSDILAEADLLAPVPLHRWRLFSRRFNQSALLARELSKHTGVPWSPDLLVRARSTRPQARLSARERRTNVRRAFRVRRGRHQLARGRRIVLIDDVMTTGATASACTRVLAGVGVEAVDVLTLARTANPVTS